MTVSSTAGHLAFLPFKTRNAIADILFYNVAALNREEIEDLVDLPLRDREGTIIVVSPSGSDKPIRHYWNVWQMIAVERETIAGAALAGVGSSALGTAALCRDVADGIGGDVAGIVTGYGLTDLVSEGLGGWFFFGGIDRFKHRPDLAIDRWTNGRLPSLAGTEAFDRPAVSLPLSDVGAVMDLLRAASGYLPNLRWLVGHSKGNSIIDFALERYVTELRGTASPLFDDLEVVTLSAVVALPEEFRRVHQVIGSIDSFGRLNSRLDVEHETVDNAWHHLNRALPAHLDAVKVIQEIAATPRVPGRNAREMNGSGLSAGLLVGGHVE